MIESHMNEVFRSMMILYCMDAPAWAKYACVSKQGFVYVFQYEPHVPTNYWCTTNNSSYKKVGELELGHINWKETLIKL